MERVLELLDEAIAQVHGIPEAGESVLLRWRIYKLIQAQKGDGDCAVYKELRCSIHLDLLGGNGAPVTLPCGHSYCAGCIEPILASGSTRCCPDCRCPIRLTSGELNPTVAIKAIVDRLLPRSNVMS